MCRHFHSPHVLIFKGNKMSRIRSLTTLIFVAFVFLLAQTASVITSLSYLIRIAINDTIASAVSRMTGWAFNVRASIANLSLTLHKAAVQVAVINYAEGKG
jgi:hypothetical protein